MSLNGRMGGSQRVHKTHCLDKVLQAQLDRQGRLSHTAVSQDHKLVQHHSTRHDGRLSSGAGELEGEESERIRMRRAGSKVQGQGTSWRGLGGKVGGGISWCEVL